MLWVEPQFDGPLFTGPFLVGWAVRVAAKFTNLSLQIPHSRTGAKYTHLSLQITPYKGDGK